MKDKHIAVLLVLVYNSGIFSLMDLVVLWFIVLGVHSVIITFMKMNVHTVTWSSVLKLEDQFQKICVCSYSNRKGDCRLHYMQVHVAHL